MHCTENRESEGDLRRSISMHEQVLREVKWNSDFLLSMVPGSLGYLMKKWYLGLRFGALGDSAIVGPGLLTIEARNIHIENHFSCWRNCTLAACDDEHTQTGNHLVSWGGACAFYQKAGGK